MCSTRRGTTPSIPNHPPWSQRGTRTRRATVMSMWPFERMPCHISRKHLRMVQISHPCLRFHSGWHWLRDYDEDGSRYPAQYMYVVRSDHGHFWCRRLIFIGSAPPGEPLVQVESSGDRDLYVGHWKCPTYRYQSYEVSTCTVGNLFSFVLWYWVLASGDICSLLTRWQRSFRHALCRGL